MTNTDLERAQTLITSIPDYPQPGVNFRDISPLIADGPALRAVTEALIAPFEGQFDIVGGLEARGFLFAGTIAAMTGVGILPIRKAGKLPAQPQPCPIHSNTAPRRSRVLMCSRKASASSSSMTSWPRAGPCLLLRLS